MRFKDKKTGAIYDDITKAVTAFMCPGPCQDGDCPLCELVDVGFGKSHKCCDAYVTAHPEEVAELIGLEILEDEPAKIPAPTAKFKAKMLEDVEWFKKDTIVDAKSVGTDGLYMIWNSHSEPICVSVEKLEAMPTKMVISARDKADIDQLIWNRTKAKSLAQELFKKYSIAMLLGKDIPDLDKYDNPFERAKIVAGKVLDGDGKRILMLEGRKDPYSESSVCGVFYRQVRGEPWIEVCVSIVDSKDFVHLYAHLECEEDYV